MNFTHWAAIVIAAGVGGSGCGSSAGNSGPVDAAGAGEASDLASGGDAGDNVTSDGAVPSMVTLTMDSFTVPAGGEVYKCQDFANPFGGQQVDITTYQLAMNPGSHHMILFYSSGASDGPVLDCPMGGLQTGPFTFGAQSQKVTQTYPEGVGATIPAGMGFMLNAHYVNPGSTPIQSAVQVTMFVAAPGSVTQHAGVLQYIQTSISIPATGQPVTSTASCAQMQDMNLLWTSSHMHRGATNFVATSGATMLFQTGQWSDPPMHVFSPPLPLKAGADITWSCTYVNDTGSPLAFGPSALTNVMCNFGATFYPVQDVSNPVFQCLQ
jgi:hypothetical protein